jgi:hypothetical protein
MLVTLFKKKVFPSVATSLLLLSCNSPKEQPTPNGSAALNANTPTPDYGPRVGVAVRTGSRTCFAIHNPNLAVGSPVVLVSPLAPQAFTPARIASPSTEVCPITKEVDPASSSYTVTVNGTELPKLTPLIAVLGNPNAFALNNNVVQADLDQNGKLQTFRACDSADGVHLTIWQGSALTGTPLWRGYYYEPSNPGSGPTCVPAEIAGQ